MEEFNVDAAVDQAFGYDQGQEIGMGDEQASEPEQAEEAAPVVQEYEYTAAGKKIKEPLDMILKRASQGYHYAQEMAALKRQQDEFGKRYSTYEEIDKYATQNPDWFKGIQEAYSKRDSFGQNVNQVDAHGGQAQIPDEVAKQIAELKEFKDNLVKEKQEELRKQEDRELDEQIQSIQGKYKDLDFKLPDQEGKTLEYKVLEFANQNGIRSFETAFKAFYHDELVKLASEKAKESVAKDVKARTKKGILDSAPSKELRPPNKSLGYEDADSILAELGLI